MDNLNFFSNKQPEAIHENDLWFTGKALFIGKRKGSHLIWKKRA